MITKRTENMTPERTKSMMARRAESNEKNMAKKFFRIVSANKDKLQRLGFQFKYLTHIYTTKTGKTYYYCYDYGYLPLDNDWFLIVKKKEE